MHPVFESSVSVAFGRFEVWPHRRELLADGQPIHLGGRAFDVLMALIEARGAIVGKDVLMARVWPDRVIEENNLQAQISALRAAFGPDRDLIRTVSGRGYQFTGKVSPQPVNVNGHASSPKARTAPGAAVTPNNLPEPVSDLIGRDDELREILSLAMAHRLVTLTGAGGIGKTCLALAIARRLLPQFPDGVWVAELAPLSDPGLVPVAVASAARLELGAGMASPERVASALGGKRLLLMLDNCEHVIDAAALMAEALLRANPAAHVVATSREPLKAEGEWVYPVPPLAVPADAGDAERDPLQYGAIRLFLERARAAEPHFMPDRSLMATTAAICRQLDGIPLAIELAAARAAALGIEALAGRLHNRFQLLTGGRRTALPRHQTLRATLDWSYELLSEHERVILRRLAVFAGAFSLEAASAVVMGPETAPLNVVGDLPSLVAKSLVVAEVEGPVVRYRLLDTMRAYALEKLAESGELHAVLRYHAEYYRDLFERAELEWEVRPTAEWLNDYGRQIDNLRAALDWAFAPEGSAAIGVALTAAAAPLWMHLSLLRECRDRVEQALAALGRDAKGDPRREMKLQAALAASLMYTRGAVPTIGVAWARALEIAEASDDTEYQLRSLWGLWSFHISGGRERTALALAVRFHALAENRSDLNDRLVGERMIGFSQHYLGDQRSAQHHIERMLLHYVPPVGKSHIIRFQTDQRVTARAFLGRILWLRGFPEQAMHATASGVKEARATNHAISLCYALAVSACPIALLAGDLDAAEYYVRMLLEHSTRHALTLWHAWGVSHQGVLAIRRGDLDTGLRKLRSGFEELGDANSALRLLTFLGEMADALGRAGQISDSLTVVDEAIARSEHTEERWLLAELLRVKGELLLLQNAPDSALLAEGQFRHALDWARRQGALSWELRAAMSLARLVGAQDRVHEARAVLAPIYDQFTEGFGTADLKAARTLLDTLR